MNTKIIIATTIAALSLATTAFAGEGEGGNQPFPINSASSTTYVTGYVADTGSAQYPAANPALNVPSLAQATLPENGQNGAVQTANSLPAGFENGTVSYMQAQSVNRWYAQQADHRFAQQRALASARHG